MPSVISSNDAKQRWGTLLGDVSERGEEVIVESHGRPKVVVVSVAAYEELQTLREQRRRTEMLDRLRQLEQRIAESNAGSAETEEEAIEFAVQVGREINAAVAARCRGGSAHDLH